MPGFKLPPIEQNDEDWGPTSIPAAFKDVPFMPYNKGDRLGRIADFSLQAAQRGYQSALRGPVRRPVPRDQPPHA